MNKLSKTIRLLLKLYKIIMILLICMMLMAFLLMLGVLVLLPISDGQDFTELLRNPLFYVVFLPSLIWLWVQLKIITNADLTLKAVENIDTIKRREYLKDVIKYLKISFILDITFSVGKLFIDWDSLISEKTEEGFIQSNYEEIYSALEFLTPNTHGVSSIFMILLLSLLLKSWDESTVLQTELDGVV